MSRTGNPTGRSWIVSFADLLSLLLCFMVMICSVSSFHPDASPAVDPFSGSADALRGQPSSAVKSASLRRAEPTSGLDPHYLAAVLQATLASDPLVSAAGVERRHDRLVISMPEQLFAPDGFGFSVSGSTRRMLENMARVLSGTGNGIVVIGHAPFHFAAGASRRSWDWEAGLARALAVAEILDRARLGHPVLCFGLADDAGDELRKASDGTRPPSAPGVDVVVYPGAG